MTLHLTTCLKIWQIIYIFLIEYEITPDYYHVQSQQHSDFRETKERHDAMGGESPNTILY